jgi:UDP-N-acetyl-D-glucosamine dehydrogenase
MRDQLLKKIEDRSFVVGVIGLGYVGLPLLLSFVEKGFRVIGFDIDATKGDALRAGKSYIKHIPADRIRKALDTGRMSATTDFAELKKVDGTLIAVPTPLNKNREPDMTYIVNTAEAIVPHMRKDQIYILESTTYPGTTDEVMVPILERSGLKLERDFYAGFSPEREDPNNPEYHTGNIPKVVGGTSPDALAVADKLYSQIVVKTVPVSSTRVAESAKLLENIFRAVNIALVNELKVAFMKMGIDVWEVIEAAKTKPFGFMAFYPGPGLGGHCIPIDPFYLTWKAREFGVTTKFIELAGEINTEMPNYVVTRTMEALNQVGKPMKGSKILLLGLAYKANVDDLRESPTFHLMRLLEERGAIVSYNDPHIPVIPPTREHSEYAGRRSAAMSNDFDAVIVATAHDEYRSMDFSKYTIPIIDTRNVVPRSHARVVQA